VDLEAIGRAPERTCDPIRLPGAGLVGLVVIDVAGREGHVARCDTQGLQAGVADGPDVVAQDLAMRGPALAMQEHDGASPGGDPRAGGRAAAAAAAGAAE
jgi:hypothetical protein